MADKKWLIILGIVNLLAAAGIVFWYVNRDNTPPVITQETEIVYEETMSDSELLQGAVAYDETDGDVSHTLVVEKITVNHNTGIAVVTCGAMDSAGNIAKQSFRMAMAETGSSWEDSVSDQAEEVFTLEAGEAVIGSNINAEQEEDTAQTGAETDDEESADDSEEAADENTEGDAEAEDEDANPDENEDEESDEESEAEQERAEQRRAQQAEEAAAAQQAEAERPILNFGASEVKTAKGYDPAWVTVITQLQDNKDTYEQLLGGLKISGNFNNDEYGAYDVMVSTVDSDGYESEARAIRIIVE